MNREGVALRFMMMLIGSKYVLVSRVLGVMGG